MLQCPECKNKRIAEIQYGLIMPELVEEQIKSGEIVLGGCTIIEGQSPRWECNNCHYRWGVVDTREDDEDEDEDNE